MFAKNRQTLHKAIEWSTHLRQTAKFQFLDIFVAIFMRAYLNMDILHTELKSGFFVYLCFCVLSLITAEVLTVLVDPSHMYDDHSPMNVDASNSQPNGSNIDRIMFLMSACGLFTGIVWSLFNSVLIVKVALRGSLTVSQSSLSVLGILFELLVNAQDKDPITGEENLFAADAFTGALVILILGIAVPVLFVLIKVFNFHSSTTLRKNLFGMMVHDWALGDVMALGLFTTLISMNSFENLSAEAPEGLLSGFYFFLMYGLSCFDLFASFSPSARLCEFSQVSEYGQPLPTIGTTTDISSSSQSSIPLLPDSSNQPGGTLTVRKQIFSKLSGSFLLIKAVGWGVFFLVWFMQSKVQPVDLDRINTALRANLGIINSALKSSLPATVGNCSDPTAANLQPCIGETALYYNKDRYEVEARWVTGINTAHLDAIILSSPVKSKLALTVSGALDQIPMSLSIGECFTPDVYVTGNCDKLWDNTDSCCGTNKRFNLVVIADCFEEFPFVRNIAINKISLDPIVISVNVIGFKIDLQDVTANVTSALSSVIEPYVSEKAFINWGDKEPPLTLADLVNKIIKLNAGGMSAQGHFTCPDPVIVG